jgi:glycosyltransferase involved in cell wall biosynthesis
MVGGRETGNETYVRGLVDGFAALEENLDLSVFHVGQPWRTEGRQIRFHRLRTASPWLRLTADLPLRSITDRLDVLHTTYTMPIWTRCSNVVTVHDICYATHPEWFSTRDLRVLNRAVPWSIRRAARVITVSELCRTEIIDHYGVDPEKVVRIYNGPGAGANPIGDAEARAELAGIGIDASRPYLLAVGNLQPRKNLVRLIAAFRQLAAAGAEVDLLIVGPEHHGARQVLDAAREASTRVRFTGYLNDVQLAACYRLATVFVFPSLFEGFGLPLIEAMSHGVPVACSRAGAMPEVCGDAVEYFDPLDVDSIAAALDRLLNDHGRCAELVEAGLAQCRRYSWAQAARETFTVYRESSGRRWF